MISQLKSAALAVTMVLGIAGVAHASQQPAQPMPRQMPSAGQPMGSQMMGQSGQTMIMNSPEARQRMATMMQACQRMMERMGSQQSTMPGMQRPQ